MCIRDRNSPEIGDYATVANPMKFKTANVGPERPHPKLGEQTTTVLTNLGLSAHEIDELAANGVIGVIGTEQI